MNDKSILHELPCEVSYSLNSSYFIRKLKSPKPKKDNTPREAKATKKPHFHKYPHKSTVTGSMDDEFGETGREIE